LGTGYVYSSKFTSDEDAINEFRAFLGDKYKDAEPRVVRMHIGKTRNTWVKNCIAIGLSNGFVEPLEATAIFSIEMLNRWLITYFPDKTFNPTVIKRYNELTNSMYNEILDFITMHYYTSNRTDTPFWVAHREDINISDSLRENLELWKHNLPSETDIRGAVLFNHESYKDMLYGKGYFDNVHFPIEAVLEKEDWVNYSRNLEKEKQAAIQHLPSNYELLTHIRKSKEEEYRIKEALKQPMHTGDIPLTFGSAAMFGSSMTPGPGDK
jgi:tryptophan halogenase